MKITDAIYLEYFVGRSFPDSEDLAFRCCRAQMYTTLNKHYTMLLGERRTCWLLLGWLTTGSGSDSGSVSCSTLALLCKIFKRARTRTNRLNRQIERNWEPGTGNCKLGARRAVAPKGPEFTTGKRHSALTQRGESVLRSGCLSGSESKYRGVLRHICRKFSIVVIISVDGLVWCVVGFSSVQLSSVRLGSVLVRSVGCPLRGWSNRQH